MKIKKLCVSIPNTGLIKTECVYSTISALFYTALRSNCGLHLHFPMGCLIDQNRNLSAQEALDMGCSHLMFIDSDMAFPENGILTLASRDKQVIGANYNLRTANPEYARCTVKLMDEKGNFIQVSGNQIPNVPFKCGAVATGFMLVQTEVFNIIPKPWFFYEWDEIGETTVGEDVYFCKKARANGIEVWCDPTIPMKHIGDYPY